MPKRRKGSKREARDRDIERDTEEEEEMATPEEGEQDFSILKPGARTMFYGGLKALKGVVSLVAGIGMGASGLPAIEVYKILNAPIQDWPNLFKETWKEFSGDKTKLQMFWEGVKGLGSGTGISIFNTVKEALIGGLQLVGGGIAVVAILKKYFGLTPEVIEAALKTGHPIGLMVGAAGNAVDRADKLCKTLQGQLEKYQSLGKVGTKALNAIQTGNYREAIEHGTRAAEAFTGQDLSRVREAASTAQRLYENPQEIIKYVQETVLPEVQKIVKKFGIEPEQIEAVKDKLLFTKDVPAAQRLGAIKGILEKNPGFGIIAQATGYHDALKKLVAYKDPELIDRLTVVNIIGEPGKILSASKLEQLKADARERLERGVNRELRDRSGGIIEHAQRTEREFKEREEREERTEHRDRTISQQPRFYGPLSSHKHKRPGKLSTRLPFSPPTSKRKPIHHGRKK